MTRIVVLDQELHEALTVVEIPARFMRDVRSGRCYHFPVFEEDAYVARWSPAMNDTCSFRVCTLRFEAVMRGDSRNGQELLFWYAYADDPELALLIRAAFLPGQVGEVQRRQREAYFRGVFAGATLR